MHVEIVVATDLSPAAEPVLDLAVRWAKQMQASIVLLHVVHDPVLAPALTSDVPGEVATGKRVLQAMAARTGVSCRVDVRTADDIVAEIVAAAAQSDYLFVGSHGRSGFQRMRLGSVSAGVLRHSHTPVLCVPPPQRTA